MINKSSNIRKVFFSLMISASIAVVANGSASEAQASSKASSKRAKSEWKVIFEDNFEKDGKPNPEVWSFPGRRPSFWCRYATDLPEMAYVKGGSLHLIARNTPVDSDTVAFQTGAVTTRGKFDFRYGRVEISAKFAHAQGAWPALWLMPTHNKYGGWPHSGEIDIMEHLNHESQVYQTVHTTRTRAVVTDGWVNSPSHVTAPFKVGEFNTYAIEWSDDKIDFYLNGAKSFTYFREKDGGAEQYPFDQDFYLILNQALGGNWVGEIDPTDLPVSMEVDYVRVYQSK